MRKVVLYIAMSLDGYIADKRGKVDWLHGHGSDAENIDTYSDFIKNVDTVVMGWNTYRQVAEELSLHDWVYKDLTSYVITHRPMRSTDNIKFVRESPCAVVRRLKQMSGNEIWICGGADIIYPLMQNGVIDIYHISVIPTVLGLGIRLFGNLEKEIPLKLVHTQIYNGITELEYVCR